LINELTSFLLPNQCYLNIGVWQGFSFLSGVLNREAHSIGVDNFSQFGGPKDKFEANYDRLKHDKSEFHDLDYIHYFEQHHKARIGIYFYDGGHDYDDQIKSLQVAEPFFDIGTVIIVDDTNHKPARDATLDFMKVRHRQYEVLFDQFTTTNWHPTYHNGLMVIQKVRERPAKPVSSDSDPKTPPAG
jgi:hypothetical protein